MKLQDNDHDDPCNNKRETDIHQGDVNHDANHFINVEVSKVDKSILVSLPNTNHKYLNDIPMIGNNTKISSLIHFVTVATECARMKTKTHQKRRQPGAPVLEKSQFG